MNCAMARDRLHKKHHPAECYCTPLLFSDWLLTFTIITLFVFPEVLYSQETLWKQTNGPTGGIVQALSADSIGHIFAGTQYGGMFRSTDDGTVWLPINVGLFGRSEAMMVNDIVVSVNQNVFAATLDGVVRSTNGGDSWNRVLEGGVYSLTVDGSTIYAGTAEGKILRSADGGNNWTSAYSGSGFVMTLASTVNGTIFAGTYHGDGVLRSTDGGNTWNQTNVGLVVRDIICLALNDSGHVFAGTRGDAGVYRSTDNGNQWVRVNPAWSRPDAEFTPIEISALSVDKRGNLYASVDGVGLFKSTNNGVSWNLVGSTIRATLPSSRVQSLLSYKTGQIFAGSWMGVFRSIDGGENWNLTNAGLIATEMSALKLSTTGLILAGTLNDGIFRSSDNGVTWTRASNGIVYGYICCIALAPDGSVFAGTSKGGIYRSIDIGDRWMAVNSGLPIDSDVLSVAVDAGNHVYAGTRDGMFWSVNGGDNWARVGLEGKEITSIVTTTAGDVLAGTYGAIFRLPNHGNAWDTVKSIPTYASSFTITPSARIFASLYGYGVIRSADAGRTWEYTNQGLERLDVVSLNADDRGSIYAATTGAGVYHSTNEGNSWTPFNDGLTNTNVHCVLADPSGYVLAGTMASGVFRTVRSISTVPTLVSPTDGATGVSIGPTLSWNASSGATSYQVQVSANSGFSTTVFDRSNIVGTSQQVSGLANITLYYWRVNAANAGGTSPWSEVRSFTTLPASYAVSGIIRYGDASGPPIGGVNVALTPIPTGNQRVSATDSSGIYLFTSAASANYSLAASKGSGFPAAYVNAADALRAALYSIDPVTYVLSPIQILAADVNNDGSVNSADALQILLRYVGTLASFSKGEWVFIPASSNISVASQNVTDDVIGLAVGDVNGDAQPGGAHFAKDATSSVQFVILHTSVIMTINSFEEFEIPLRLKTSSAVASISLAMKYPLESATFVGARGPEGMLSAANNGVVRIAWFGAEHALHLKENDVVLTIRFKPTGRIKDFDLTLDPTSQITDDLATVLTGVGIEIPSIEASVPSVFALGQNYPNPFNPSTMISYQVPNPSSVSLSVFNTLGQVVATLVGEKKEAGYYTVKWNAKVPSGIYFYRLQAGEFIETKKMILVK